MTALKDPLEGWCDGCRNAISPNPHLCEEFNLVNGARMVKCKCNCSEDVKAILRERLPLARLCILHENRHYMTLCDTCLEGTKNYHHWWCDIAKESAHGAWIKLEDRVSV